MSFPQQLAVMALALAIILPVGVYFIGERGAKRYKRSLLSNLCSFGLTLIFATVFIFVGSANAAAETAANPSGLAYIGAAISTGLGSLGAGLATGQAASAALGALSENEGVMGKALIFVALAEGIAIYGLIISIMILNNA